MSLGFDENEPQQRSLSGGYPSGMPKPPLAQPAGGIKTSPNGDAKRMAGAEDAEEQRARYSKFMNTSTFLCFLGYTC
ncbi:hypothetical protein H6G98_15080 [Nostoc sp. FACHB-857]|nr:hypothetical protein [Nostoc sp. FACHB-857]